MLVTGGDSLTGAINRLSKKAHNQPPTTPLHIYTYHTIMSHQAYHRTNHFLREHHVTAR